MSQNMSMRAYARYRGISEGAVRKAVITGRITANADGTLDVDRTNEEWRRNTDPTQQRGEHRPVPNEAIASVRETLGDTMGTQAPSLSGTTLLQARTANEVLKAQTNKVRLARLKGDLVDRAQAVAHVYKLARTQRDAWLNWPARVSAQLASELDVDAHLMHQLLELAVREHLQDLGDVAVRID
mgnify:FL=1|jgi:hypothetical protein